MNQTFLLPRGVAASLLKYLFLILLLTASATAAQAATRTVTKTADTNDGVCNTDCSLREAIAAATAGDVIQFAQPLFSTSQSIELTAAGGTLLIDKNLTINGPGANLLTVIRSVSPAAFRVLMVAGTANVTVSGLKIMNGSDNGGGGGVLNDGTGTVTIRNCAIVGNYAGDGGGARNVKGSLVIENSTFVSNMSILVNGVGGAGIHSSGGSLTVTNSTIAANLNTTGIGSAGGIAVTGGTAIVSNSTIADNQTGGPASAGGIRQSNGAVVTIRNTIVAASRGNDQIPDVAGDFVSQGYNLIGSLGSTAGVATVTGFGAIGDQTGNNINILDPGLGQLSDNGGGTSTFPLKRDSRARDKGKSFGLTTDQRGLVRPADNLNLPPANGGDNADIGAFEIQNPIGNVAPELKLTPYSMEIPRNTTASFQLEAYDANGDASTFQVYESPGNGTAVFGTVSCTPTADGGKLCQATVVYTPAKNYIGDDYFTVLATDGRLSSTDQSVNVYINTATLMVTKTDDTNDGVCNADCSLREAIAAAGPSGDSVEFASPLFDTPQTIVTGSEFYIDKSITIRGRGARLLTIRATGAHRIFWLVGSNIDLSGMTMTGGYLYGSYAAGVLSMSANATITDCWITGNRGPTAGGIGVGGGTLVVRNSTLSDNTSDNYVYNSGYGGGAIYNQGTVYVINSTISGNTGDNGYAQTGGIFSNGPVFVTNSTITNNRVAGAQGATAIYNDHGTTTVKNSIIAGNQNNAAVPELVAAGGSSPGIFASGGHNLIGNPGAVAKFNQSGDLTGSSAAPLDPRLAPLGDYGGATLTHALFSNSPAVDTANPADMLPLDQRGVERPLPLLPDIGAYELDFKFSNAPMGAGGNGTLPNAAGNTPYAVRFSAELMLYDPDFKKRTDDQGSAHTLSPASTTFSVLAGSLPPGLVLDPATGILSGTPTGTGTFNFTLKVYDSGSQTGAAQKYVLTVLSPTAAGVSVSGRVSTPDGRGLRNAILTLTHARGNSRTVTTGVFGYYSFDGVAAGDTVVISVQSKQYKFAPRILNVSQDITEVNFTP